MSGKISEDVEVKATVNEAWEVYTSPKVGMIIQSELGHLFEAEILEGDGGVGTIIKVSPRPGVSTLLAYKERYTKIDHEIKMKEVEIIEGGFLDLGFISYRFRLQFLDNQKEDSCIARVTMEYEANEDVVANLDASIVNIKPLVNIIEVINRYIQDNRT